MKQVELFAVSTGPGSFTGLRVGLATVKAWAEVYAKNIVGVPRLEAIAHSRDVNSTFAATCYDAQRDQLFGGCYHYSSSGLERSRRRTRGFPGRFCGFRRRTSRQPACHLDFARPGTNPKPRNMATANRRRRPPARIATRPGVRDRETCRGTSYPGPIQRPPDARRQLRSPLGRRDLLEERACGCTLTRWPTIAFLRSNFAKTKIFLILTQYWNIHLKRHSGQPNNLQKPWRATLPTSWLHGRVNKLLALFSGVALGTRVRFLI